MIRVFFLTVQILLLIPSFCLATKAYYVDPQAPGGGNGSYERPWNSIAQVNTHKFSNGDDLYFRAGTRLIVPSGQMLDINWDGTSQDRVVVGAYYGENKFGLGGNPRPIIDGKDAAPSSIELGLIDQRRTTTTGGYITVQDLHIKDSYGIGINLSARYTSEKIFARNNIVRNCIIANPGRSGIMWARASYGLIENNIIYGTIHRVAANGKHDGAAIEVTGMSSEAVTRENIVRGNILSRNHESIGIYKGAIDTIVEDNVVYDFARVGIYIANSRRVIIRNNLVYEPDPSDSFKPSAGRRALIWLDAEGHIANIIKVAGEAQIYNNYLAGGSVGIWLQNNSNNLGVYQKNNKIYNNRIVDCNRNIWIHQSEKGWEENEIYNNYSFVLSSGLVHVYNDVSPSGVDWNGNYYNSIVSGNAAKNANINKVSLKVNTKWRSLIPGHVTVQLFNLENEFNVTQPKMVKNFKIKSQ